MMRFIVFGLAVVSVGCGIHQTDLEETLEWMDNTYNPHSDKGGSNGHGKVGWYTTGVDSNREVLAHGTTYTFTTKGCSMSVTAEPDPAADTSKLMMTTYISSFQLGDIDLSSINVKAKGHFGDFACEGDEEQIRSQRCDHASISFSTRNSLGLITEKVRSIYVQLTGSEHQQDSTIQSSALVMEVDDPVYAQRFEKAFAHAVELCGGKPSKF